MAKAKGKSAPEIKAVIVVPPPVVQPPAVVTVAPNLYAVRDKLSVLLEGLLDIGVPVTDKDGNAVMHNGKPLMRSPDAATLSVIRQFLRDNGCTSDPLPAAGKPLTENLPFDDSASPEQPEE